MILLVLMRFVAHPLTLSTFPFKIHLLFMVLVSTCSSCGSWNLISNYNLLWLQKDSLMDMSFHVPTSNTQFPGNEDHTSAQVKPYATLSAMTCEMLTTEIFLFFFSFFQILLEEILKRADARPGSSGEAVATFEGIAILTPRWEIWIICRIGNSI